MYGLQLYSLRDITEKEMPRALRETAKIGYTMIEPAGFFGIPAGDFRAMAEDNGLRVSSTHTGWAEIRDHFQETIEYHRTIGNNLLIVPGHDLSDQEKLSRFVKEVNEFLPKIKAEGFRLAYHNHSHEFVPNADGSVIYPTLRRETEMLLEVDTYWAYHAGVDPVQLMDELGTRIPMIHIKDGMSDGTGKPLGRGEAPVKAVWKKAREMQIPMIVESETLDPDGLAEARICIECLKGFEKA